MKHLIQIVVIGHQRVVIHSVCDLIQDITNATGKKE